MKTFFILRILLFIFTLSIFSCDNSESMIEADQMNNDPAFKTNQSAKQKEKCTTIKDGTIVDGDGMTIQPGFNQTGYNYQAKTYSGERFPESSPGWHLNSKWNDAFLSTQDCTGDGYLDIANGQPSYRGSGAWITTKWTTTYTDQEGNKCEVFQFAKYVAVPVGAEFDEDEGLYYDEDGNIIGEIVDAEGFEDFANVQFIINDPCAGTNGFDYKAPGHVGLGNR